MPVNEIHAPIYIKGKIATPAYPAGHAFRLYFHLGSTWSVGAEGDEENWRILSPGAVDAGSVSGCVDNLFDRAGGLLPENSHITQIELWESADGANELVHLNPLPTGNSYGSGAGIASASAIYVFGTALRPQFRFTLFDGGNVAPQRVAPYTPTTEDDGTIQWFFLKSPYPLANNDGLRLTRSVSFNSGYNEALKKKYGRTIVP